MDKLVVKGARENNLKNLSIELPKNKLIVMTGVSGSGKSSLAFDTIYQEGERRFVESLSSYARQFIGMNEKPNVDSIDGLSPAISIDQKSSGHNPRSTVGTVTEIYDYLRVLFARCGTPYCPTHKIPIKESSRDEIINHILELEEGTRVYIGSPVVKNKKGEHKDLIQKFVKDGLIRAIIDGEMIELNTNISLEKNKKHNIDVIVDRFKMKNDIRSRIAEDVDLACRLSDGLVKVIYDDNVDVYSERYACLECGYTICEIEPSLFSFNSPLGACPECKGLGYKLSVSRRLMLDENKSLNEGAIIPYRNQDEDNLNEQELNFVCKYYDIDQNIPFKDIDPKRQDIILYGSPDILDFKLTSSSGRNQDKRKYFEGVINNFERRYMETNSEWIREWITGYMVEDECPKCHGKRLNDTVLNIFINDKNIDDLCSMSIENLYNFFLNLDLGPEKNMIGAMAIKEIKDRLKFLINVGLEYLTLKRSANTLSGGEAQRIRLATQIGSKLSGILYVLDEPSIGLHQRDNDRLIKTMQDMRDLGNTLIVVEHDHDTMLQSDYLVDVGPGAGIHGGTVVAQGTPEEVMKNEDSITGKYLSGKLKLERPRKFHEGNGKFIEIIGAKENNLKNIDVKFPLGKLICVTGVSGSGKSSLVNQILLRNLNIILNKDTRTIPGKCKEIRGVENINRIIDVSQQPIGRTPRSNPATYTGVFDDIRELFSQTLVAKERGYDKGRFSFNAKGGRCEACKGDGVKRISMHFLPDVFVPCEVCKGTRYQKDTLEVLYKGKSISDVLNMRIEEAYKFFDSIPKIKRKLETLIKVGLGYMTLGQSSPTISGGEAQRVKLAKELSSKINQANLYILDEPSTGLHIDDIKKLMNIIYEIVDNGATVIIIEHNLDIIKCADYVIDLGPEGGDKGGTLVFSGSVDDLVKCENSYTGKYLKQLLEAENGK